MGARDGWLGQVGQDRSGRSAREGLATHVLPPNSEGHNYFVRTLFRVFSDSMKSPLTQDSIHMPVDGSGCWGLPSRAGWPEQFG